MSTVLYLFDCVITYKHFHPNHNIAEIIFVIFTTHIPFPFATVELLFKDSKQSNCFCHRGSTVGCIVLQVIIASDQPISVLLLQR